MTAASRSWRTAPRAWTGVTPPRWWRPGCLPGILLALACAGAGAGTGAPPDTIAQRSIACIACHGRDGRATSAGVYPRIAGKPATYLYNQLLNFREGRRRNPAMAYMVDPLSDAYLREIADYFASRDPPYAASAALPAAPAVIARGRQLVQSGDPTRNVPACVACHGTALTGRLPAIPGLRGLSRDYLNAQFGAWKSGTRRAAAPDCMAAIATRLTLDDIAAAATWLAAQPPPAQGAAAPHPPDTLPLPCGSQPE